MSEILYFVDVILDTPADRNGAFMECGAFKGESTAKFSIACRLAGRRLIVCDSFEGIPENDESDHMTLDGKAVEFPKGSYMGGLEEVEKNIADNGAIEVCEFVKGYFEETLPEREDVLVGVYLDVDLASSTRTCIGHLWPRLVDGGWLMSQDGHLRLVLDEFKDPNLWVETLGEEVPHPLGFGEEKLIRLQKTAR
ncbi:TylF/MycF/NovP-related O-methyltransferase [Ovoidimarina sediminis]|uniref:TylF/MycF/NovP-related O-methyltransferase n=1 Tax=Ovoidimarina sediminis TaxID=3079856 RepID=UPI002913D1D1|nr:TylF/MycF/NovP-related O-methyltransferase [Rhodophyticola sp. MJ-SS7]MDU8946299.1 TylF/MycF/NovP-related O-methyltransferase [Rhodophyticola sp. MJ-SS7]